MTTLTHSEAETAPSVIVRDDGFHPDDYEGAIVAPEDAGAAGIELGPEADVSQLGQRLDELSLIRVAFPSFADGRGFTLARRLRAMGYRGRLRAHGHVLADQYAMARRAGFDEVEIGADIARRQPEDQWLARADWQAHDYQARLRG